MKINDEDRKEIKKMGVKAFIKHERADIKEAKKAAPKKKGKK